MFKKKTELLYESLNLLTKKYNRNDKNNINHIYAQ